MLQCGCAACLLGHRQPKKRCLPRSKRLAEFTGPIRLIGPQQTKAPKGYKPFYVSHYGRHSSRYLVSDRDYKSVITLFEAAHAGKALSELGEDVYQRLLKVWEEAEGHGGDLTPLGVRQHRGIAERMYAAFSECLQGRGFRIGPFYGGVPLRNEHGGLRRPAERAQPQLAHILRVQPEVYELHELSLLRVQPLYLFERRPVDGGVQEV